MSLFDDKPRVFTCPLSGRYYKLVPCSFGKRREYLDGELPPAPVMEMEKALTVTAVLKGRQ